MVGRRLGPPARRASRWCAPVCALRPESARGATAGGLRATWLRLRSALCLFWRGALGVGVLVPLATRSPADSLPGKRTQSRDAAFSPPHLHKHTAFQRPSTKSWRGSQWRALQKTVRTVSNIVRSLFCRQSRLVTLSILIIN